MKSNTLRKLLLLAAAAFATATLGSSCLPLAAGAAAGYIAHDEGYRVQTPLTKDN